MEMKLKELQSKLSDKVQIFVGREMGMSDFYKELNDLIKEDLENLRENIGYPCEISFSVEWFIPSVLKKSEMNDPKNGFKTIITIQLENDMVEPIITTQSEDEVSKNGI